MAAKKKAQPKKVAPKPDLSNRPLVLSDLPAKEQENAEALMSRVSETMPEQLSRMAHTLRGATAKTQMSSRKRYTEAAPQAVRQPMSVESMAKNRTESFMRSLTGPHRLESEDYTGQEFYFKHRGEIDEIRAGADAPNIPLGDVLGATAKLSVRTKPEAEKASAKGLLEAHARGTVSVNEELLAALPKSGQDIPAQHRGKEMLFSELPSSVVKEMVNPQVREKVAPHLSNVNLGEISKSSMTKNVTEAHEVLQGNKAPSPTKNPKLFSYQQAHEKAVPGSPEHGEYQMRAMNLGQVARGEQPASQMMFDFYGLRGSNEGVLSNQLVMAEDSWMNAVSYDQPAAIKKAAGDVTLSTKKSTTKRGRELSVGKGNKDITPIGIQHAVNTAATQKAAQDVQETLGVDYTVPSMMIQEGVWAETRRSLGKDAPYNKQVREQTPKTPRAPKASKQLPLF